MHHCHTQSYNHPTGDMIMQRDGYVDNVRGKFIVVTGANTGLGEETAKVLYTVNDESFSLIFSFLPLLLFIRQRSWLGTAQRW